jgi:NAD(P)-dependent dehydrogenase (short-subunit alcohol dehydrogenase family)
MNILITGGSSGLGKAIVYESAKDPNNKVYFTYQCHKVQAEEIEAKYLNTKALVCDFNCDDSVNVLLNLIPSMELDAIVNNAYAGEVEGKHFHKTEAKEFLDSFGINIIPTIKITQKVLETFRKRKHGKIITVLTAYLLNQPPIGYSLYTANKAYLAQLAKTWSKEYIKYGITSNCVSPNFMQTELTKETNALMIEQMISQHPLNKLLTVEEVATTISFLLNSSNQINGVNIPLNAGINIIQ